MGLITIIIIAVGLAMDAFAVSIVSGIAYKRLEVKHALRIAVFFGGFQAFMPLIGYLAALSIKDYITRCDHWVAFGLLSAVGGKMIYELANGRKEEYDFGLAEIEFMEELTSGRVMFGPDDAEPILGVTILESVVILVDPIKQILKRMPAIPLK